MVRFDSGLVSLVEADVAYTYQVFLVVRSLATVVT